MAQLLKHLSDLDELHEKLLNFFDFSAHLFIILLLKMP